MNQQYPPPPYPPTASRTSTTAVISLISGIAGWTFLPVIGSLVAIITGHIAKGEIKRSGGTVSGNGLATWGLVLGYITVGLSVCGCITVAIMMAMGMTIPFVSNIIGG